MPIFPVPFGGSGGHIDPRFRPLRTTPEATEDIPTPDEVEALLSTEPDVNDLTEPEGPVVDHGGPDFWS